MNVSLTPQHEALVREKVESGWYVSKSEVIRDALRLLEERDKLERLRGAIAVGWEQIDRGERLSFSPELVVEIGREVEIRARQADVPSADVCP